MNSWGNIFRLTIWGESHGAEVGVSIDGVPAGIALSEEDFVADLDRRRAGAACTTTRKESDQP
ncbi:MAG: chorismate synthase, partial [Alistipes sp.]|nr:chorismate synthase [Alistipes sp.]